MPIRGLAYGQIEVNELYGYRRYPLRRGDPLVKVKTIEHTRRGKWRVLFFEEGQMEIVASAGLVVPWAEDEVFLDEEKRLLKVLEQGEGRWSGKDDDPTAEAINTALNSPTAPGSNVGQTWERADWRSYNWSFSAELSVGRRVLADADEDHADGGGNRILNGISSPFQGVRDGDDFVFVGYVRFSSDHGDVVLRKRPLVESRGAL